MLGSCRRLMRNEMHCTHTDKQLTLKFTIFSNLCGEEKPQNPKGCSLEWQWILQCKGDRPALLSAVNGRHARHACCVRSCELYVVGEALARACVLRNALQHQYGRNGRAIVDAARRVGGGYRRATRAVPPASA
eukprot:6209114-Pleurochrysis_carterae.AAC.3